MLLALLLPGASGLPVPAGRSLQSMATANCTMLDGRTNFANTTAKGCYQLVNSAKWSATFSEVQTTTGGGNLCENYYKSDYNTPGAVTICYPEGNKCKGYESIT